MSDTGLLLPSSSTRLERDLSASMNTLERVAAGAELIRTAKRENIPDSVVPFLIYEYGLGELLPYLSDPRTAIATGVLWQRLRGTPQSFRIALGWIGNDGTIEESEGGTINWSQFQLGLASAPVDLSQTDSVVEIGRLSSPVRSSLFRIYGGWYDGRRFKLDEHMLSGLDPLCDHTGVYLKPEWPQLSFGREFKDEQGDISGDLAAALGIHRATGINGLYEDRTYLSNSVLGETSWRTLHIEDLSSVISRLHFSIYGPFWNNATDWAAPYAWDQVFDWAGLQNKFTPALKFARAGMYLSDYAELGDTNACLPVRELTEFGDGAIQLSEGNPDTGEGILSEHLSRVEFVEINERFERNTDAEQTHVGSVHLLGVSSASLVPTHREHTYFCDYDDTFELSRSRLSEYIPIPNLASNTRAHTTAADQFEAQSDQWQDTESTWGNNPTGSWETVASYFGSLGFGSVWDQTDTWETGDYFEQNDRDTWGNTYAWQVFPQLEQVLGFSRTMLTLSENGHLSDSDGILATLTQLSVTSRTSGSSGAIRQPRRLTTPAVSGITCASGSRRLHTTIYSSCPAPGSANTSHCSTNRRSLASMATPPTCSSSKPTAGTTPAQLGQMQATGKPAAGSTPRPSPLGLRPTAGRTTSTWSVFSTSTLRAFISQRRPTDCRRRITFWAGQHLNGLSGITSRKRQKTDSRSRRASTLARFKPLSPYMLSRLGLMVIGAATKTKAGSWHHRFGLAMLRTIGVRQHGTLTHGQLEVSQFGIQKTGLRMIQPLGTHIKCGSKLPSGRLPALRLRRSIKPTHKPLITMQTSKEVSPWPHL